MDFHRCLLPFLPRPFHDQQPRFGAVVVWRRGGTNIQELHQVPVPAPSVHLFALLRSQLKLVCPFNDHWPSTTHTIIKFTTAFFKINIYLDLIFLLLPSIAQKSWSGYIFQKAFGITYIMATNIQAIPKSFWIVPCTSYQCL